MRREVVVVGMCCALLLAGVVTAWARGERELSEDELRFEMVRNHALAAYVERNGTPDLAEGRFLADQPPWDDHEVTLYYLDARKEIAFTRAWILGRPEIHLAHYERPLTDEQVQALSSRARTRQLGGGGPAERAELAASRAEDAAGRVETAAGAAERAADRAEAVASKMEGAFHRALRK